MKILFTGGGGAGNEAIWRRFQHAHELFFADADSLQIDPAIPADHRLSVPFANEPDFGDRVMALCHAHAINLLVPGVDEELPELAGKHGGPVRILLPPLAFVTLMLDKLAASRAIGAAGLTCPETRPLAQAGDMAFPLIAKPRSGRGSRGVVKLERSEQVEAYLTMQNEDRDKFIAQALCPGQEYTVFVQGGEHGELRAVVPVRVVFKRGITLSAVAEPNDAIVRYAQAFQDHFRPSGIYNIQCTLGPDGKVYPFEVNPRISTTFCLAVSTGFDPFAAAPRAPGAVFVPSGRFTLRRHWKNIIEDSGNM